MKFIPQSSTWNLTSAFIRNHRQESIEALIIETCPEVSARLKGQIQLCDELLELPKTLAEEGKAEDE